MSRLKPSERAGLPFGDAAHYRRGTSGAGAGAESKAMPLYDSSRPPLTRRGDRVGRRRDILRAASEILATGGYGEMNMRAIARRAGVSAGTTYSYFASKEEIFATLLADRYLKLGRLLDAAGATARSLLQLMQAILPHVEEMMNEVGQHGTVMPGDDGLTSDTDQKLEAAAAATRESLGRAVSNTAMREGVTLSRTPGTDALLWSLVIGLAGGDRLSIATPTPRDRQQLAELAARMVMRGLAAGS